MALNPHPAAGLRNINYDARSAAKVELRIPAGDTLHVSDDVAEQLLQSSTQFKDTAATPPAAYVDGGDVDDVAPAAPAATDLEPEVDAKPHGRKGRKV
jgi:hypothetical protein